MIGADVLRQQVDRVGPGDKGRGVGEAEVQQQRHRDDEDRWPRAGGRRRRAPRRSVSTVPLPVPPGPVWQTGEHAALLGHLAHVRLLIWLICPIWPSAGACRSGGRRRGPVGRASRLRALSGAGVIRCWWSPSGSRSRRTGRGRYFRRGRRALVPAVQVVLAVVALGDEAQAGVGVGRDDRAAGDVVQVQVQRGQEPLQVGVLVDGEVRSRRRRCWTASAARCRSRRWGARHAGLLERLAEERRRAAVHGERALHEEWPTR